MIAPNNSPQKKSIPYVEILKQAGLIVWQKRFLLWFGLLMALGSPGSFNIGNNNNFGPQGDTAKNFFALHWGIVLALVVILIVIGIVLFLISLVAKAGLVKSVNLIARSKEASFKGGWRSGRKYLGKIFGLAILFILSIFVVLIVLAIPIIYLAAAKFWFGAILVGLLAIAIFIPLIFIFILTKIYAEFYIVLSGLHVRSAIEAGYDLLTNNILNSLIFALLLIAVSTVAIIILFLVAGISLVILVPVGFVFFYLSKIAFAVFLGLAILLFLTAILFVSTVFQTFKTAAWTLFFQEIAKVENPEPEKVAETELKEAIAATPEKV
jgi:hypothetical protein